MTTSAPAGRSSSRTTLVGVVAAVAVVVPATWFGVRAWLLDDSAEPIPTEEVVADFREATATTTTAAAAATTATDGPPTTPVSTAEVGPPSTSQATVATTPETTAPAAFELPLPGVYRYVTTGFEEIDAVVSSRHDYPAETTITVTPDGCGVRLRWDALRERREEWRLCITDRGVEVQPDSVQYHEFFDRGEEEPVECERAVLVAAEPAAIVTEQECVRVDEVWLPVWENLGAETLIVEDGPVEVIHLRQQVVDDDEYWEFTTIDWYLAPTGLPVRIVNVKESNSSTFVGDVVYEEEYELDLVSLTPAT